MLILALVVGVLPGLSIFANSNNSLPPDPPDTNSGTFNEGKFVPGEVLAPADSLIQAETIAATYGLELKSYAYGIAVMIAPDPEYAIAQIPMTRLIGIPQLSLNWIYSIDEFAQQPDPENAGNDTFLNDPEIEESTAPYVHSYIEETFGSAQWHHAQIESAGAWGVSTGEGVVVAIIDTGIDAAHPKFSGKILENSYNSLTNQIGLSYVDDDHGHGTHISGIVAASMDGDPDICGVAPDAKLLIVKSNQPDDTRHISSASWVRGLNYAAENGANVINMSFSRHYSNSGGAYSIEQRAIASAIAKGITIVCAAGNNSYEHAGYPAAYPGTIAVSALRQGGLFDDRYSNYGPEIDIAAPGTEVYSTAIGGGYMNRTGTSMASSSIAGVAALIKSSCPDFTPEEVWDILCKTASLSASSGKDIYIGYGIVNAYEAVIMAGALRKVPDEPKNPDSTLASLAVNPGTLVPEFSADTLSYTVAVENDVDSILITATTNNSGASADGAGTRPLIVGENLFTITVTAEDGSTREYVIVVTRAEEKEPKDQKISTNTGNKNPDTPTIPPDEPPSEPPSEPPPPVDVWINPYTDVAEPDWFYEAVQFVTERGLMKGTDSKLFSPLATMTRAMLVTILFRLEDFVNVSSEFQISDSGFSDITEGAWYCDAVVWAAINGIVEGYGNGKFGTNDPVTCEQVATILYRYAKTKGLDVSAATDLSEFADANVISAWALEATKWAVQVGILQGLPGDVIAPKVASTRAEIATIFRQFVEGFLSKNTEIDTAE